MFGMMHLGVPLAFPCSSCSALAWVMPECTAAEWRCPWSCTVCTTRQSSVLKHGVCSMNRRQEIVSTGSVPVMGRFRGNSWDRHAGDRYDTRQAALVHCGSAGVCLGLGVGPFSSAEDRRPTGRNCPRSHGTRDDLYPMTFRSNRSPWRTSAGNRRQVRRGPIVLIHPGGILTIPAQLNWPVEDLYQELLQRTETAVRRRARRFAISCSQGNRDVRRGSCVDVRGAERFCRACRKQAATQLFSSVRTVVGFWCTAPFLFFHAAKSSEGMAWLGFGMMLGLVTRSAC